MLRLPLPHGCEELRGGPLPALVESLQRYAGTPVEELAAGQVIVERQGGAVNAEEVGPCACGYRVPMRRGRRVERRAPRAVLVVMTTPITRWIILGHRAMLEPERSGGRVCGRAQPAGAAAHDAGRALLLIDRRLGDAESFAVIADVRRCVPTSPS